jgi:hypothetical protein
MVFKMNRGIKERLGQEIRSGRPAKVYKWRVNNQGVPAQTYYKYLRNQNNQIQNAKIQQVIQKEKRQIEFQRSPSGMERNAIFFQEGSFKGDIDHPDLYNI